MLPPSVAAVVPVHTYTAHATAAAVLAVRVLKTGPGTGGGREGEGGMVVILFVCPVRPARSGVV